MDDQWQQGRFIPIFLKLLADCVNRRFQLVGYGRKWTKKCWEPFTVEFNKRVQNKIRNTSQAHHVFLVDEVISYGHDLKKAYEANKSTGNLQNFNLYQAAFGKCETCAAAEECARCHGLATFTGTTRSRGKRKAVTTSTSTSSKRSRGLDDDRSHILALSRLSNSKKIDVMESSVIMEYFKKDVEARNFWLELNEENRIAWVKYNVHNNPHLF